MTAPKGGSHFPCRSLQEKKTNFTNKERKENKQLAGAMFRQVSLTTLVRPLLFLAILFVAMVLYLSERQNAIDRQVGKSQS